MLWEWGFDVPKIDWIGDPALYCAHEFYKPLGDPVRVLVNIGITYNHLFGFDEENVERVMLSVGKDLIENNYDVHSTAARSIAEEYFNSAKILQRLIEDAYHKVKS